MNARIHNRAGQMPTDGWFQIEVAGEHPAGEGRTQVIDQVAMESIVNRFQAEAAVENFSGMLVDKDHLSHDLDNTTEAMAWAQELAIRNGQLHARFDLTDLGESAIRNKRYKFTSTEYDPPDIEDLGNGRVRPLRLAGLALTNRPNNRGSKPLSNRSGAAPGGSPKTNQTVIPKMKNIATKLGLPAESDEAAILTEIESLLGKLKTMSANEASTTADAIMNRFGDRIPADKRADVKARLITNRADTEAMLELLPSVTTKAAPSKIFNRETASNPDPASDTNSDPANETANKSAAAIRNRANEIARAQKIPFNRAFGLAKSELS